MRPGRRARALPVVLSMKYTPELYSLTVISTATALMWVPYVVARMTTHGVMRAIGNPGPDYPVDAPWVDRARRAHLNAIENVAVFAPLVLVGHSSKSALKPPCCQLRSTSPLVWFTTSFTLRAFLLFEPLRFSWVHVQRSSSRLRCFSKSDALSS
jgi:hypothetical protein